MEGTSPTRYTDGARDMYSEERREDVELNPFAHGSVVEIEGSYILNLRRRHAERRTFEQDPAGKG